MTAPSSRWAAWLLLSPALIFVVLFFLFPVVAMLLEGFQLEGRPSLYHFVRFFTDDLNLEIYWRTLWLSGLATLVSAIVCYPAAYGVTRVNPRYRGLLTGLIILPLMTSTVARTFAWLVLLGGNGLVNVSLLSLGIIKEPLRLLFNEWSVFAGLLQLFMPLMMISLVSAMENLPRDVVPAARSLGASEWQVFGRVIFPLTREGLVVGGTLVFTGCITAYVTPAILGGSGSTVLAVLLYQKANVLVDYPTADVIAMVMLFTTLGVNALLRSQRPARRRTA